MNSKKDYSFDDEKSMHGKSTQQNDRDDNDDDEQNYMQQKKMIIKQQSKETQDKEEGDEEENEEEDEEEEVSWITWFCSLKGNEFFCEVDEEFIQDDFNLCGLSHDVPFYEYALDMILDLESPLDDDLPEEHQQMVESAAETLYGLIHARFILTTAGIFQMEEKFNAVHFGRCPRVLCQGSPCLPVGQSDKLREGSVKIYCPKCNDIYFPRSSRHRGIDGAYWGSTFPHLFLMSLPEYRPPPTVQLYEPKIFGFRVSFFLFSLFFSKKTKQSKKKGS